jgi:hypothetical protein
VLLQQGKEKEAVAVLKAFVEQVHDNSIQRDTEKEAARKRLQERLKSLFQKHPELQSVERSQIVPVSKVKKPHSVSGLELLEQMTAGGGV